MGYTLHIMGLSFLTCLLVLVSSGEGVTMTRCTQESLTDMGRLTSESIISRALDFQVLVNRSHVLCLSPSDTRGAYQSASLLVEYSCSSCAEGGLGTRVEQFTFDCGMSADSGFTWNVDTVQHTDSAGVEKFNVTGKTNCALCEHPDELESSAVSPFNNYDPVTHCISK